MMTRRKTLHLLAMAAAFPVTAAPVKRRTAMGLVMYCCNHRRNQLKRQNGIDIYEPLEFLRHVRSLGTGGVQVGLKVLDAPTTKLLREEAEAHDLYIEAIISPPRKDSELDRFEAEMKTAASVGARAVRTVIIPGRRYEYFDSLEKFRAFEAAGKAALERATPIAEKLRLPLAVENHKDQRVDERVALLEHISSAYVGCCVDTGNTVALLDEPVEAVRAFAPWAHAVHLKDQAVQLYPNGFLLGDVALGQGYLNLKKMVAILRKAKPRIRFSLELITRDPLKVPCLAESYWPTFPDVPAIDLATTLRAVRSGAAKALQKVSTRTLNEQVVLESSNVEKSIQYARSQLGL